jgi:hypothetical protein
MKKTSIAVAAQDKRQRHVWPHLMDSQRRFLHNISSMSNDDRTPLLLDVLAKLPSEPELCTVYSFQSS